MSLQKIILTRVIIFLFLIPYTHALVEPSYFVLTSGEYSTNLGNLTGADSKCLTDLSNSTWLGKSNVVLNADKVEAFLCTSSLCSTLASNTEYFFAKSGSTTAGGASFTTNGSGIGPADSTSWEGLTYFNVSSDTNWWSNRAPDPTSPTLYF
ncbi:hypothetical protein J4410_06050 [Candidatus Woesearchaeota archaeon]|nr:hypothetical protein [Candidatus Woesearchaeota archaeon]